MRVLFILLQLARRRLILSLRAIAHMLYVHANGKKKGIYIYTLFDFSVVYKKIQLLCTRDKICKILEDIKFYHQTH